MKNNQQTNKTGIQEVPASAGEIGKSQFTAKALALPTDGFYVSWEAPSNFIWSLNEPINEICIKSDRRAEWE